MRMIIFVVRIMITMMLIMVIFLGMMDVDYDHVADIYDYDGDDVDGDDADLPQALIWVVKYR